MKATSAVRDIMEKQGVKLITLASRMNKGVSTVSERLRQDNITVEKLNELLRLLDYKVVVVPRSSRIPDGGYEVE